jgi:hypothetical protein
MNITITKEFMYKEAKKILESLFNLPEVEEIVIKDIEIPSLGDECLIGKAIDECFHDMYSDVDIQVKVKINQAEYDRNSAIYADCLTRLGFKNDILGMSHYCTEERGEVIRICKTNGMRFDLIIIATCTDWSPMLPHDNISKSLRKANDFWFTAIQALGKLMRKDYLISAHLAHMLIQEGLVLQMLLRDSEKNTNFHRYGYAEELDYLTVFNKSEIPFTKSLDDTYNYIAKLLYSAVRSFDILYTSLDESYISRIENFLNIWSCYSQLGD